MMSVGLGKDSEDRQSLGPLSVAPSADRLNNLRTCVNFLQCLSMMRMRWMGVMLYLLDSDRSKPYCVWMKSV